MIPFFKKPYCTLKHLLFQNRLSYWTMNKESLNLNWKKKVAKEKMNKKNVALPLIGWPRNSANRIGRMVMFPAPNCNWWYKSTFRMHERKVNFIDRIINVIKNRTHTATPGTTNQCFSMRCCFIKFALPANFAFLEVK